jgi:hypothetical protein
MGMENYPMNVIEFERQFSTEEACLQYLTQLRWPEGYRYPRCQHRKAWLTKRSLFHCAACGYETSVIAGTIFQDTRKPLQVWFLAIWHIVGQKNGVSAKGLQRVLGVTRYETIWIWLHKLRIAMVRPGRERLSGTVEVDETYIGGQRPEKEGEALQENLRLANIMRQPWLPQSKKGFWDLLPGKNPQKFLFLKPNPLVNGMIAQVYLKNIFSLNFGHTNPSATRYYLADKPKDFSIAPRDNGEPKEKRRPHTHATSRHDMRLWHMIGVKWKGRDRRNDAFSQKMCVILRPP